MKSWTNWQVTYWTVYMYVKRLTVLYCCTIVPVWSQNKPHLHVPAFWNQRRHSQVFWQSAAPLQQPYSVFPVFFLSRVSILVLGRHCDTPLAFARTVTWAEHIFLYTDISHMELLVIFNVMLLKSINNSKMLIESWLCYKENVYLS